MVDYAVFNLAMCLDLNTRCFEAANALAEIYDTSDRKPLAIDFYQRSLAVNDNQAEIHCALGDLYEFFCERDLAVKHFIRATEIDPGHVRAHCNLVRFYLKRGDRASADRHFQTSYRLAKIASGKLLSLAEEAVGQGNDAEAVRLYSP